MFQLFSFLFDCVDEPENDNCMSFTHLIDNIVLEARILYALGVLRGLRTTTRAVIKAWVGLKLRTWWLKV